LLLQHAGAEEGRSGIYLVGVKGAGVVATGAVAGGAGAPKVVLAAVGAGEAE